MVSHRPGAEREAASASAEPRLWRPGGICGKLHIRFLEIHYRAEAMATKFNDYIGEVEDKANAAGPESVARWDAFNAHYAMAREMRELRKARNLTQKQLAAASGIDQAEISRIERGQTNPTTSTLAALLGPLGARLGVVAVKSRDVAQV